MSSRADRRQGRGKRLASFLRVGSWIGGDRDGNPFVTADVLREAMRLQSARALGHYLDELHELGGELSLSGTLMRVSAGAATRSPSARADHSAESRATSPIAARSPASIRASPRPRANSIKSSRSASRSPTRPPMQTPRSSPPISTSSSLRWRRNGARILARGRLRRLRRAVDVFGFHLAPLDLRQNSDVHERTVAELFAAATPGVDYLKLDEDGAHRPAAAGIALAAPARLALPRL